MDMTNLTLLADDLAALDVEPPLGTRQAIGLWRAAQAALHAEPTDDLRQSLAAGKLTPANVAKEVLAAAQRESARAGAGVIVRNLEHPLGKQGTAALLDDGDRIVEEMRASFGPAAAVVTRAAEMFDADPDPTSVLVAGAEATEVWQQLPAARAVLDRVHAVRLALARAGYGPMHPPAAFYIATAEPLDGGAPHAFTDSSGPGGRWHRLARVAPLRLNTAAEARALLEGLAAAQLEQQQQDERAHKSAVAAGSEGWMFPAAQPSPAA